MHCRILFLAWCRGALHLKFRLLLLVGPWSGNSNAARATLHPNPKLWYQNAKYPMTMMIKMMMRTITKFLMNTALLLLLLMSTTVVMMVMRTVVVLDDDSDNDDFDGHGGSEDMSKIKRRLKKMHDRRLCL